VVNKPYTFSNQVALPVGTRVAVPILPIHLDEKIYKNANEFDGFRFSRMRDEETETAKSYCVNTNTDFLAFGHGTHAWYLPRRSRTIAHDSPGRFLAVNAIKLMLAFVILRYDVKTENGVRPADWEFQGKMTPDLSAKILIRRREVTEHCS
jgi:cytochrome P450